MNRLKTCLILTWISILLLVFPAVVQAQYNYTTNNGTITITKYMGNDAEVTIPSIIDGLPVTSIGGNAFYSCTSLTNVTIPNSITSIGSQAFYYCVNLTSVVIPNSVTGIGSSAFSSCTSLAAITVDALNSVYCSVDGVLFNKSQTTLIQYPAGKAGSYTIPNTVTNIGGAFSGCTSLTSVTIPNSVTSIWGQAFSSCTSLTSVTIPNSVTSIWGQAFSSCTSLTNVTIPNSITSIGSQAFYYCVNLTSVTIGNSVTSIGYQAFYGCYSLTNVTIPNSITRIETDAFYYCYSLTGVYFKGNAPSVGGKVFELANNVTVYYLAGSMGWRPTFAYRPTKLWNPQVQTSDSTFGVQTNRFGFNITGTSGLVVVVEACTNPANPSWLPLQTNTLNGDSFYYSDPQWTNYSARFYRLRSP